MRGHKRCGVTFFGVFLQEATLRTVSLLPQHSANVLSVLQSLPSGGSLSAKFGQARGAPRACPNVYQITCHCLRCAPQKVVIVDARSYAAAVANRARGGGVECHEYYPSSEVVFMNLPNIHAVRKSFQALRALLAAPTDHAK